MDERLQTLWRTWQEEGSLEAGLSFLRQGLLGGTLGWEVVEVAAFLGDPAATILIGEDALAIRPPGAPAIKTLVRTIWSVLPEPEVALRLALACTRGRVYERLGGSPGIALDNAILALDGEAASIELLEHFGARIREEWVRHEDPEFVQDLYARTLRFVATGQLEGVEALMRRLLQTLSGVSSTRPSKNVRRALLPWLLTRGAPPREVAPELAASRATRLEEQPTRSALFLGGALPCELPFEVTDEVRYHRRSRWSPYDYSRLARRFYAALGWSQDPRDEDLLRAPVQLRRLRILGTKAELLVRGEEGDWVLKPSMLGLPIYSRALGEPIRDAIRASMTDA